MPSVSLANLEQLRKQAKALRRAHRDGDLGARERVSTWLPRPSEPLKLTEAQFVLARELGFPSWPKLRAYVTRVHDHGRGLRHLYHPSIDYYAERADGLLASATDGTPSAVAAFARHDTPLTRQGARVVVAAEHGFGTWHALRAHVNGLAGSGEPFARAYRTIEQQDVTGLTAVLDRFPELVHARGTNDNDLLGMAGATCDERLVRVLLDRGADPASTNAHGWTCLHQAAYSNLPHLARVLLDAGAPVDVSARGDGGTPLVVALFWGNREVAELLATLGPHPRNLRVAAGLGMVELIRALLAEGVASAGAHRGFYRPHGGFPAWRPSDDLAEVRDEAIAWAARNDRVTALDMLAASGANLDADVYRGTALTWAAACGQLAAVRRLLELGADPDRRGTFGGPDHGQGMTALHIAAQDGRTEVIQVLLDAGADPTIRDERYDSTPAGWAEHFGQRAALRALS